MKFSLRSLLLELACTAVAMPGWLAWFNLKRNNDASWTEVVLVVAAMLVGTGAAIGGLIGKMAIGGIIGFLVWVGLVALFFL